MRLRDDVDVSGIDWTNLASLTRRDAEKLPLGARRNAEIDRAFACEALAHSADVLLIGRPGRDCGGQQNQRACGTVGRLESI